MIRVRGLQRFQRASANSATKGDLRSYHVCGVAQMNTRGAGSEE